MQAVVLRVHLLSIVRQTLQTLTWAQDPVSLDERLHYPYHYLTPLAALV
jgi:hypothetical protein